MIKIGRLNLGNAPRVAAVITDDKNEQSLKNAIKQGADLLELRIDFFKGIEPENLSKTVRKIKKSGIPLIATVRSKTEGGKKSLTDRQRKEIFQYIISFVDAVDIELSSKNIIKDVVAGAKKQNKKVIVSYHNFKETPSDRKLNKIIKDSKKAGADIVKLAAMANKMQDVLRLANLTLKHKNLITLSMGETAKISRIIFPIFGSLITYGTVGLSTAPGQMPLNILKRDLRFYKKGG